MLSRDDDAKIRRAAAFDRQFLAVRPDYLIEVRKDILDENDGPMLLHGLKEMHEKRIILPRHRDHRPNAELLARRYEKFLADSEADSGAEGSN